MNNFFHPVKSLVLVLFAFQHGAYAAENYWELGAGATAINLPLYPGSSQDKAYVIPFPYFRIQTEYFEVDDGIKGFLFESPDLRLNVSADLGVPVNSEDSTIRHGMPDLDTVLQFGPSLEIIFAGGRRQPHEFRLELPVRLAFSTDLKSADSLGWVLEPRLTYETLRPFKNGWAYQVSTGLRYASSDYHAYYYDVPAAYAIAQRPEYYSDSGYSGYFLDLAMNWRQDDLIYFAFMRYQNLNGTAYEDSPLVQDENYFALGVGLVWMFADSRK